MKVLLLFLLLSFNITALESSSKSSKKDSTSFNVSSLTTQESHSNDNSVTHEDIENLRQQMARMQTDHEDRERKSKCKVFSAFIGGVASVMTSVASAIYAIKYCRTP